MLKQRRFNIKSTLFQRCMLVYTIKTICHSLFKRYLQKFRSWSFARKFGLVFSPAEMGLFNKQYCLNNGKYLKIMICIWKKIL